MNKIIYAITICAAIFCMGCKSSDKAVNTTPVSLDGTAWFGECEDEATGAKYEVTLSFFDDGHCTWVLRDGIGDVFASTDYTYEYAMPNLTLFSSSPDEGEEVAYNGFVLDKDQASMNGYNVYTIWLYDTHNNLAASLWKF